MLIKNPTGGRGIQRLIDTLDRPREAWEAVAEILTAAARESFRSGTDPWGGSWAPQSAATLRRKGRGPGWAHLADLVTVELVDHGDDMGLKIRVSFTRARQFQEGEGRQPARPFMPVRGGRVDPPGELRERILAAFREKFGEQMHRGSEVT